MENMTKNEHDKQSTEQQTVSDVAREHAEGYYIYQVKNENMVTYLYGSASERETIELVLKKRRSLVRYAFPVEWTDDTYWTAHVNASDYDFTKGTWDYYVKGASGELRRVGVASDISFDQLAPLYCPSTKGAKVLQHYETEKGNVSFVSDKVEVHLSGIKCDKQDNRNVAMTARLDGLPIWQHQLDEEARMTISERNSREPTDIPCQLEKEDGKYYLSFQVDYEGLIASDPSTNRRWDVFVHLCIDGVYEAFQFALTSGQIAYDSRVQFDDDVLHQLFFYQTIENHLALNYTEMPLVQNVDTYKLSRKALLLEGYAYFDAVSLSEEESIERSVIIKAREDGEERVIPLKNASVAQTGFQVKIALKDLYPEDAYDEIYDIFIELTYKHITKRRKLGCDPFVYYKDDILAEVEQTKAFRKLYVRYYLTYTPNGNLKLEAFKLTHEIKTFLKKDQYQERMDKDVWLIGERSDTAQDTGYHFFKYCRKHYPDKDIYYVIDSDSNDIANVEDLANVVYRGTLEHFKKASVAGVLIGSHDLEYILPIKGVALASYKQAKKVFLQHGVLGRKSAEYHRHYYKHPFDMFCVSSVSEKKLVQNKMDYDIDEVKVTGLSRFDALLEPRTESRSILVIPTWREWLNDKEAFGESEYFNRYKNLLESERLQEMLETHDMHVYFYPHYRMQDYIDQFDFDDHERIHVIKMGEKNVQDLLLESKLMITDYSSVSFDFNYMSKPVIFYHFDQDSFFKNGKLRPIDETFLGDICTSEQDVLDQVETYMQSDFAEKEAVRDKKYLIFDHIDQENCKRIYDAIEDL